MGLALLVGVRLDVALLELVLKATLVLAAFRVAALFARHRGPAVAHMVWLVGFGALLFLPALTAVMPPTTIELPGLYSSLQPESHAPIRATNVRGALGRHATLTGASGPGTAADVNEVTETEFKSARVASIILVAAWCVGAAVMLGRIAFGLSRLRTDFLARSRVASSDELPTTVRTRLEGGWIGSCALRECDIRISTEPDLNTAMTWGLLKPIVLLPSDATNWSQDRTEAVLLHEIAHVRRKDFASQLLAEVACALFWFHPLAWLGARAMREDAEMAADDTVLETGLKPSAYAAELVLLAAQLGGPSPRIALQGVTAMNNNKIESRIASLLSDKSSQRGLTKLQALSAVGIALLAIPAIASIHSLGKAHQAPRSEAESAEARNRLKQAVLATTMYSLDYDNNFPYVKTTADAVKVLWPYSKTHTFFESPTAGGKVLYNLNVGGVNVSAIKDPASTPLWWEKLPDASAPFMVGYVYGNVKEVSTSDKLTFLKALAKRRRRAATMVPVTPDPNAPGMAGG